MTVEIVEPIDFCLFVTLVTLDRYEIYIDRLETPCTRLRVYIYKGIGGARCDTKPANP